MLMPAKVDFITAYPVENDAGKAFPALCVSRAKNANAALSNMKMMDTNALVAFKEKAIAKCRRNRELRVPAAVRARRMAQP